MIIHELNLYIKNLTACAVMEGGCKEQEWGEEMMALGSKYSRTKEEWRLKKMREERTERENCDRIQKDWHV